MCVLKLILIDIIKYEIYARYARYDGQKAYWINLTNKTETFEKKKTKTINKAVK